MAVLQYAFPVKNSMIFGTWTISTEWKSILRCFLASTFHGVLAGQKLYREVLERQSCDKQGE